MADVKVKATATVTLSIYRDTESVTRYYKLQTSSLAAPSKPTTNPPSSDWVKAEPACDITKTLYFCDISVFSNGTWSASEVSKSSSYEAAKEAYNKAQSAQTAINNLEIGGRNLFIETDYENIKTQGSASACGWYSANNLITTIVDDNSEKAAKIPGDSWYVAQYVNVEAGETYTMSCFARLETERSGAKLYFRTDVLQIANKNFDKELTTDYQKFTYTWTCEVGGIERIHIRTANANDVLYVKKIKFEKGNKATDWSPAPEDVQADIDAVKVDVTELNTEFTRTKEEIALKANKTEVYTKGETETAITSKGYLTVTSDAITSKVSKNEVISSINQTAESVKISASKIDIEGAVTFSSFDTALQNKINAKAETSDIPTKVSELTNDSSFATTNDIPTKVSELTNDSSFATTNQVSTAKTEAINSASSDAASKVKVVTDNIYSTGTTTINGGKITSGSITATQIAASTITANKINLDELQTNIARIGSTSSRHVLIDSDSVYIKNGRTVLASFGAEYISLGKEAESSTIGLCGDAGKLQAYSYVNEYDESVFQISMQPFKKRNESYDLYGSALVTSIVDAIDAFEKGRTHTLFSSARSNSMESSSQCVSELISTVETKDNGTTFLKTSAGVSTSASEGHSNIFIETRSIYDGVERSQSISMLSSEDGGSSGIYIAGDKVTVDGILYPQSNIIMPNNYAFKSYNSSNVAKRLIGMGAADHIYIGETAGTAGMYCYVSYQKNFRVLAGPDQNECISSIYDSDAGHRYTVSKPIYDRTTSSGTAVRVGSNGRLYRYSSSSMRYKEKITTKLDPELDPERLYDLKVWQYKYREGQLDEGDQRYGATHIGLLAEDVKQHYPIAANYNEDGYVEDWSERYLLPPMLKLIQNQHEDIEQLKQQVNSLIEGANI